MVSFHSYKQSPTFCRDVVFKEVSRLVEVFFPQRSGFSALHHIVLLLEPLIKFIHVFFDPLYVAFNNLESLLARALP